MQSKEESIKFGFYCNVTNVFYCFETEEEFMQMVKMLEQAELQDMPQTDCQLQQ
jgi:hypothetical protein